MGAGAASPLAPNSSPMPPDQLFVCILVLVTVGMFLWEKISPDVVAMGALFLLLVVPFNGQPVLSPDNGKERAAILGGIFGNNAILTVTFMFIIGAAVEKTGLVEVLGRWFERIAGGKGAGKRPLLALGLLAITTSAFLNNTTVVVVFIPMVLGMCRRHQLAPSRFLIPLSYFSIVGGMCTMIGTSTNLVVNGIVKQNALEPFTMFEITGLGLLFAAATLGYMLLAGHRMLPERTSLAMLIDSESTGEELIAAIVGVDSPLVGHKLTDTPLAGMKKLRLIEVRRSGNRVEVPLTDLIFEAGDRVILKCHRSRGDTDFLETTIKGTLGFTYVNTEKAILMEGMVGPHSALTGRSLVEINFRQHYGVLIVAIHREGENQRENFEHLRLEVGDTLLIEGSKERMAELFSSRDIINLSEVSSPQGPGTAAQPAGLHGRWPLAMAALLLVVVGGTIEILPFEWVAMGGALLVVFGGCLKKDEIYRAVEWKVICMILGTLGLGIALSRSGAAETIVTSMLSVIGQWDHRLIVSAMLLLSIIFTEALSNNAVAALLTPLAIQMGHQLGCDPRPFVVAVMAGASTGFAIPTGYQTHMLVYGAGGYRFSDFLRVGLVLDIICWVIGSMAIPLIWKV